MNNKNAVQRVGGYFIEGVQNIVGWRSIKAHGAYVGRLGSEVFRHNSKGEKLETFAEIEATYGINYDDAKRTHRLYSQSFFVISAVILVDLLLLMKSVHNSDYMNAVVCFSMFWLFAASATRYAYHCYELRNRTVVPFIEFCKLPAEWIPWSWEVERSSWGTAI